MCPNRKKRKLIKARRLLKGYKRKFGRFSTIPATRHYIARRAKGRKKIDIQKLEESLRGKQLASILLPGPRYTQYFAPRNISISTHGLTQAQIDLLKEMERRGEIPPITWIVSSPSSVDDKIRLALMYLHSEGAKEQNCQMHKGYDYAWIKMALDHGRIPSPYQQLKFMSTPTFVGYIQSLGFKDIAGSKTLNKFIAKATWLSEAYIISFKGVPVAKPECDRRNNIALKFLEIVNEI